MIQVCARLQDNGDVDGDAVFSRMYWESRYHQEAILGPNLMLDNGDGSFPMLSIKPA